MLGGVKSLFISLLIVLFSACIGEDSMNYEKIELRVISIVEMNERTILVYYQGKSRTIKFSSEIFCTSWIDFVRDYKSGRLGIFVVYIDKYGCLYGEY